MPYSAAPPTSLKCINTSKGLDVTWEPVKYPSCDVGDVNYYVTFKRQSDMTTIIPYIRTTDTTVTLTSTLGLQPASRYVISVSGLLTTTGSCEGQGATVTCDTSPSLMVVIYSDINVYIYKIYSQHILFYAVAFSYIYAG